MIKGVQNRLSEAEIGMLVIDSDGKSEDELSALAALKKNNVCGIVMSTLPFQQHLCHNPSLPGASRCTSV